jgi:arylsulfatase A-like enzyme
MVLFIIFFKILMVKKQKLPKIVVAGLFLFYAFPALSSPDIPSDRPNFVVILTDDLGYGDVSCYNENSRIQAHNLDKLATEGILFTDAYATSAACNLTRYGIFTGRCNWRSQLKRGVLSGYLKALIETDRKTPGKLLQTNDYHTAFLGKWHLGWDWHVVSPAGWQSGPLGKGIEDVIDFGNPLINGPQSNANFYCDFVMQVDDKSQKIMANFPENRLIIF